MVLGGGGRCKGVQGVRCVGGGLQTLSALEGSIILSHHARHFRTSIALWRKASPFSGRNQRPCLFEGANVRGRQKPVPCRAIISQAQQRSYTSSKCLKSWYLSNALTSELHATCEVLLPVLVPDHAKPANSIPRHAAELLQVDLEQAEVRNNTDTCQHCHKT